MKRLCLFVLLCAFSTPMFADTSLYDSIPVIVDPSQSLWSKDKEKAIGEEAYYSLYRDNRIIKDIGVNDYLASLGNSLATWTDSRVGYHFFVTNARTVNAFAGIGGTIGINAGLWIETENEHELAAVLAHEIAHVSRQHIAQMLNRSQDRNILNLAMLIGSALVATAVDSEVGTSLATLTMANEQQDAINIIRAHEKEADRFGRSLMQRADYDVRAMKSFFAKLYQPDKAAAIPEFLLTHPLPVYREADADDVKLLSQRMAKLTSSDDYWFARAWVMGESLLGEEFTRQINRERQVARLNQSTQQKRAAFYAEAIFSLKNDDKDSAHQALTSLLSSNQSIADNLFVLRLAAKVAEAQNNPKQAESHYQRLQKLYPNVLASTFDYAQFLAKQDKAREAKKHLTPFIVSHNLPADVYQFYADLLADLGDTATANRVLIDYYAKTGQYELAMSHIAAMKRQFKSNPDWQLSAIIDEKAKYISQRQKLLAD